MRHLSLVDAPHIVMLRVNNVISKCLIDTGSAVTLAQYCVVEGGKINPHGTRNVLLTGVTGHSLDTYGTARIQLGPVGSRTYTDWHAIICGNDLLGDSNALIGRDFLSKNRAELSYGPRPSLKMWGIDIPMYTKEQLDQGRLSDGELCCTKIRRQYGVSRTVN